MAVGLSNLAIIVRGIRYPVLQGIHTNSPFYQMIHPMSWMKSTSLWYCLLLDISLPCICFCLCTVTVYQPIDGIGHLDYEIVYCNIYYETMSWHTFFYA